MAHRTVVRLMGGLGNQLFQCAYAYKAMSTEPDSKIVLDRSWFQRTHRRTTSRLYELGDDVPGLELVRLPYWLWDRRLRLAQYETEHAELTYSKWPRLGLDLREGYWQSATCVQESRTMMSSFLHERLMSRQCVNLEDAVAVHVRIGDYLTNPQAYIHGVGSVSQQINLGLKLAREVGTARVIVYTDSADLVEAEINGRKDVVISNVQSAWDVLACMSVSRGLVMGNSSLSWWAAWVATLSQGECRVLMPYPWTRAPSRLDAALYVDEWQTYQRTIIN